MTARKPKADDGADLTGEEKREVAKRKQAPPKIVHEIVRQQGVEELERPLTSLLVSGFAAGVSIWLSLMVQSALLRELPSGPSRQMLSQLGYSVGFVVVILGRLQLFTESTITAVLPLASDFNRANFIRTLRLWAAVFAANMAGTLLVAAVMPSAGLITDEQLTAMREISGHLTTMSAMQVFAHGIPAGFILATVAWILPSVRGQELWVVTLLTWIVSLCGFSHVIAGSAEAWLLATTGDASWGFAIFGFILPALAGNILGGTGLFAILAHAQVRSEVSHN